MNEIVLDTNVPFLQVALTADVPLVTGNARDFPADIRHPAQVLSPSEFLAAN